VTDELTITARNAPNVTAFFDGVGADLAAVADPLYAALAPLLADAAGAAPVDTGRLAGSHTLERYTPTVVRVANTAAYARMVHDGTRYMRPRPWLALTVEADLPAAARRLATGVQADIDGRAART
jgi:hypothetical protein